MSYNWLHIIYKIHEHLQGQLSAIRPLNYTQESSLTLVVEALSQASSALSSQATVSQCFVSITNEISVADSHYSMPHEVLDSKVHGANMGPIWGR